MMIALMASVSVMAQDSKKAAAPVKTETKATTAATKPESKKCDNKKSEAKTEKKSTSSVKK